MAKGKAVLACAYNIKQLSKISAFIRKAIEGFKGDLNEVKSAVNEIKLNFPQF